MTLDPSPNARALQLPPIDGKTPRTRLTPIVEAQVIGALKVTGSIKTACVAVGIPWPTAKDWLAKGKKGLEPYAAFTHACKMAKEQREIVLEGVLMRAALGLPDRPGQPARAPDWKAANALRKNDRRSAAQRAHDDLPSDHPVLVYPVPVQPGDDLAAVALAHGATIDTHGEPVPEETDDDRDDEQP